jgi:hypothetical protein
MGANPDPNPNAKRWVGLEKMVCAETFINSNYSVAVVTVQIASKIHQIKAQNLSI